MTFRSYTSYKESGVEWMPMVPLDWKVKPLFALASERKESNKGMIESNLLSLSYGKIVQKNINSNEGLLPESFETYQIVHINDMVFRLTDLQNDKRSLRSAIVKEDGIITSAYTAVQPINIQPDFLNSVLRAYDLQKVFYSMGDGLRQSMKYSDIKRLPIPVPPHDVQIKITKFLDRETGKLDTLISKQEHLIELLQEKRQAIISHAVTKGLNPDVTMKESGVKWLGMVPSSWSLIPFKYIVTLAGRIGFRGYTTEDLVEDGEGAITLSPSNLINGQVITDKCTYISWHKYNESPEIQVKYGDVIMVKTGSTYGKVAMVKNPNMLPSTINPQLVIFKNIQCDKTFLYYLLSSTRVQAEIEVSNTGSTIPTMTQETIGNIRIALPASSEQVNISSYLDYETAKIDILIDKAKRSIELAKEHRSALISAAVTGKIDVREAA